MHPLLFLIYANLVLASPAPASAPRSQQAPLTSSYSLPPARSLPTASPLHNLHHNLPSAHDLLRRDLPDISTCGYLTGDPNSPTTADPGYNCRTYSSYSLWGFCPTTIAYLSDCNFVGRCVDYGSCSNGCGTQGPDIITLNCYEGNYCASALLTATATSGTSRVDTWTFLTCESTGPTVLHLQGAATAGAGGAGASSSSQGTSTSSDAVAASSTDAPNSTPASSTPIVPQSQLVSTAAIAGGVVGGLAILALISVGVFILLRRTRTTQAKDVNLKPSRPGSVSDLPIVADAHSMGDGGSRHEMHAHSRVGEVQKMPYPTSHELESPASDERTFSPGGFDARSPGGAGDTWRSPTATRTGTWESEKGRYEMAELGVGKRETHQPYRGGQPGQGRGRGEWDMQQQEAEQRFELPGDLGR